MGHRRKRRDRDDELDGDDLYAGDIYMDPETGAITELTPEDIEYMHNAGLPTPTGGYSGGGYTTPATPYTSHYVKCDHDGLDPEFEFFDGKVTVSGARGNDVKDWDESTKLIIDLAGAVFLPDYTKKKGFKFLKSGPPELLKLLEPEPLPPPPPHAPPPTILKLEWADQGAPCVELAWWGRLLHLMRERFEGHTIIACIGGHGRTGTAIASLLLTHHPDWSVQEAIEHVREWHCEKAVESESQALYLARFRPSELKISHWLQYECGVTRVPPPRT